MIRVLQYLWALPATLVGLLFAAVAFLSGGSVRVRGGIVEVHGGAAARVLRGNRWRHGGAAMTLGHVVLARNAECLVRSRPHELEHVRQYERWGPLTLPLYWLIAAWLAIRGRDPYLDHPFERMPDKGEGD